MYYGMSIEEALEYELRLIAALLVDVAKRHPNRDDEEAVKDFYRLETKRIKARLEMGKA